jgi:hypothetical protein
MLKIFKYILFLINLPLFGQIVHFDFLNYSSSKISKIESTFIFDGCNLNDSLIPFASTLQNGNFDSYIITNIKYEDFHSEIPNWSWPKKPLVELEKGVEKGKSKTSIKVYPFIKENGIKKMLSHIDLKLIEGKVQSNTNFKALEELSNSVLNEGTWFKFKIPESGIYEITFQKLIELGILNEPLDSKKLSVFSNQSKMLPFIVGEDKIEDLKEIPLNFKNLNGTEFGDSSSFRFYAEGNGYVFKDENDNFIKKEINLYSDTNFIFLNINSNSNKLVNQSDPTSAQTTLFDNESLFHNEKELSNFIKSGRIWVGEPFTENSIKISYPINKPLLNNVLKLKYKVCARSDTYLNNKISLILEGDTVGVSQINKVSSIYYNDYAKFSEKDVSIPEFSFKGDSLNLELFYHQTNNPLAWIDYVTLNYFERISTENKNRIISIYSPNNLSSSINVKSDLNDYEVWDVSDIFSTTILPTSKNDSGFSFVSLLDTTKKFIIVEKKTYPFPVFQNKIANQNLHNSSPSNYIIITIPQFEKQAQKLIELHKRKDGLSGEIFFTEDIFNEFACGRPEASAIRNFIKTLYDKGKGTSDSLQYVLLMGEGSYDNKNRLNNNINFIPTFQSNNSTKLTNSYVTDDIYGLMDEGEGDYSNGDLLDIAVGRFPIENALQAEEIVNKIYEYYDEYVIESTINEREKELLTSNGAWKNNIVFIADDEDFNEHMRQSNSLSERVDTSIKNFNTKRIFLDAYPQEITSTGEVSPVTNEKLIKQFHDGVLIANYTGHGGERGWTSERIFLKKDIVSMKNRNKLPLFMTATCEFSRFDNPENVSAGELLLLQPRGGAIALFTTVRLVFSIPNFKLNETFYKVLESSIKHSQITIGDLFRKTKVQNNGGTNDRNFTLLGDPALKLAFPLYKIKLDSTITEDRNDSIKALSVPKLYGHIENSSGDLMTSFNGELEVILYDKKKAIETLGDDHSIGSFNFTTREDILFKGKTYVRNGHFSTQIFIPKDTRQDYGSARFSFYAVDSMVGDASGHDESIIIGGTSLKAANDHVGPEIEIYLDDSTFTFGDNVSTSPVFIANLLDSSGINIIPNDIGKDISLIIDERTDLNFLLNQYYKPSESTYQKGEVIFPLEELDEGRHSLIFKVFDNQNNSSKAYTEFIIENNPKLALNNVLNYPNPFTTTTGFYFDHNQTLDELEVLIEIFTISGKLIKTILSDFDASSKRIGPIQWNGLDDFGTRIGRGVYIYKVQVKNSIGENEEVVEKLVILR